MDLPTGSLKHHECTRCCKTFNYAKTLEKHMFSCKENLEIAVQTEAQEDIPKDENDSSENINQAFKADAAPMDGAVSTYSDSAENSKESFQSVVAHLDQAVSIYQGIPKTETVDYLINMDAANMESNGEFVKGTLATVDDDKIPAQEIFEIVMISEEEEQKWKTHQIIPSTSGLRNHRIPKKEIVPKNKRCEFCGAAFTESSQLEDHRNKHLEVKKRSSTQCYICFKSYKNLRVLYSHRLIHTSRHKCEHCGQKFESAYRLKQHLKRHLANESRKKNVLLGIKTHKCTFCSAAYSFSAALTKHMNKHHKAEIQRDIVGQNFSSNIEFEDQTTNTSIDNEKNSSEDLEFIDCKQDLNTVRTKSELTIAHVAAHICTICSNAYNNRGSLELHLISHTSRFKCDHCNKTFQSARGLEYHQRRHLGLKPFECTVCKSTFFSNTGLKRHMILHSDRGHQCEICGRGFIKKSALEDHRNIHLGIKTRKCNYCLETFLTASALKRHTNYNHKSVNKSVLSYDLELHASKKAVDTKSAPIAAHGPPNINEVLRSLPNKDTRTFVKGTVVAVDDNKDTAEEQFALDMSSVEEQQQLNPPKVRPCNPGLSSHSAPQEEVDGKNGICEFCDATFTESSELEDHRNRHLEVKQRSSRQCHICFKSYKNYQTLYSHRFMHTSRHKCEHCGKKFESAYRLKQHLKRHLAIEGLKKNVLLGIKPHKCTFCPAAYSLPAALTKHMNKHHKEEFQRVADEDNDSSYTAFEDQTANTSQDNEKNPSEDLATYTCLICSNAYKSRRVLERHIISHTTRYKCEYCSKSFQSASSLEYHQRRHLGIKPFQCTVCTQAFPSAGNLKKHERKHSNIYKCDVCEKVFSERSQRDGCEHNLSHDTAIVGPTSNAKKDNRNKSWRLRQRTTRKNNQLIENQLEEPDCNAKSFEIRNPQAIVKLEDQDSPLKDAICFQDEQKFKPFLDMADGQTAIRTCDPETEFDYPLRAVSANGSRISTNPTGKNNLLKD